MISPPTGRGRGWRHAKSCPQWEYSDAGSLAFANSRGFIRTVLSNIVDASIQRRAEEAPNEVPKRPASLVARARREVPSYRSTCRRESATCPEDRAQHPAHDLATEGAADAARGALGEGLDGRLATLRWTAPRGAFALDSRCGQRGFRAASQVFIGRFAVDGLLVFPGERPLRDRLCDFRWRGGPETRGGRADRARSTAVGTPFSSSIDTRASPTASSVMASATSRPGLAWKSRGGRVHRPSGRAA